MLVLTKYDSNSKYNVKNLTKIIKGDSIFIMPYNTLYFEATEEEGVIDLFFRIGRKGATDENAMLVYNCLRSMEGLISHSIANTNETIYINELANMIDYVIKKQQ